MSTKSRTRLVVLISGRGSNLQSLIDAVEAGEVPATIRAVISNVPGVEGLERARRAGIEAAVVDHRGFASREAFDLALGEHIAAYEPELIVLAGFMRVLGEGFVRRHAGRMLNIHPSLLPDFPGLNTHERVLEAGRTEHGATVHFVTPSLDAGPVVTRARVPVLPGDSAEMLAARVLEREHDILPRAVRWFCEGRLRLEGARAMLDGRPIDGAGAPSASSEKSGEDPG